MSLAFYAEETPKPKKKRKKSKGTPDNPLENDIKNAVLNYLPLRSDVVWYARINSGVIKIDKRIFRAHTKPGMSDIIGQFVGGRFFAIETKRPKGSVTTEDQKKFINEVNEGGGLGIFATSVLDVVSQFPPISNK